MILLNTTFSNTVFHRGKFQKAPYLVYGILWPVQLRRLRRSSLFIASYRWSVDEVNVIWWSCQFWSPNSSSANQWPITRNERLRIQCTLLFIYFFQRAGFIFVIFQIFSFNSGLAQLLWLCQISGLFMAPSLNPCNNLSTQVLSVGVDIAKIFVLTLRKIRVIFSCSK